MDAWANVTILADPTGSLALSDVIRRAGDFRSPQSPRSNLGDRPGVTWLRVPVVVSRDEDDRWVMDIDSPALEHVDIYLVANAAVVRHFALGSAVPFTQRPIPTRSHAVLMTLEPGRPYEVIVRVTATKLIVPISFLSPMALHDREAREQVVQGILAGIGLCLLGYGLAQWLLSRDRMFLDYAVYVFGSATLSFGYFGFAAQHLWRDSAWLSIHAPVLAVFLIHLGAAGFTERALSVGQWNRRLSIGLAVARIEGAAGALAVCLGVLDFQAASAIVSVGGPLLLLMSTYAAVERMRRGDRAARWMVYGWVVHFLGLIVFLGMFQGLLPATYWTQHAMQFVSLFEAVTWLLVLGVRTQDIRESAQRAGIERDTQRVLAQTDALTGLPNRRGLSEVLQRALPAAAPERLVAVYLLDLDGFKAINDRLGHDAGDDLLVGVAKRLKSLLRASDTIARLGGDEFVVVALHLPNEIEARRLGQKLLDGIGAPFDVAGQTCHVGLTVGYALAPRDGLHAAELLKRADSAMYSGKHAGRNCMRCSGETATVQ